MRKNKARVCIRAPLIFAGGKQIVAIIEITQIIKRITVIEPGISPGWPAIAAWMRSQLPLLFTFAAIRPTNPFRGSM